jgi:tetratricopeptide (TPR) repeat protein
LLRRIYAVFSLLVLLYLIGSAVQVSRWNKERLYRRLASGRPEQKASAGLDLAYLNAEAQLLRALRAPSEGTRLVARSCLSELWARAGGHHAFNVLQAANRAKQRKAYGQALQLLTELTSRQPDFAEAWNQRATLYWQMGRLEESVADAKRTVALNPNHFAAWQGMGMVELHLGEVEEACRCIEAALRITPHDQTLRSLLDRCEELRDSLSPGETVHYDLI